MNRHLKWLFLILSMIISFSLGGEICGCVEGGAYDVEAWTVFAPADSHIVGQLRIVLSYIELIFSYTYRSSKMLSILPRC